MNGCGCAASSGCRIAHLFPVSVHSYISSLVQVATLKNLGIAVNSSLLLASHIHVLSSPVGSPLRTALPSVLPFLKPCTMLV